MNVYAKDVGLLPDWQQQIWAGYNITPEGGVSTELRASQVRARPADTQAPEEFLLRAIEEVNKLSLAKLGIKIFRDHEAIPDLITKTHRFRGVQLKVLVLEIVEGCVGDFFEEGEERSRQIEKDSVKVHGKS